MAYMDRQPWNVNMSASSNLSVRPFFLWAAMIASPLMIPALMLHDRLASGGGDGLLGFWSGAAIVMVCALTIVVCLAIGLARGEKPRRLGLLAVALGLLPMLWLTFF